VFEFQSEIKRIEEAWQDIAEHEKHIKDQSTEKMDPQQTSNLRQRQTHLNEAKELLLQEQESVSKNHKELEEQLENDQKTLEKETWKEKEEFQLKKQNVLLTLSPGLSVIDQDIYNTQKCKFQL
jgi:DNA repair exonuclease SbcCD ATPase subunit